MTAAGTENPVVQTLLSTAAVSSGYAPVLLPVVAYRNLVGGLIATDLEGFVAWEGNRYSLPVENVTELLPVRITQTEIFVYAQNLKLVARH